MLGGLAVGAALTALIAGIAGAWSPCGFSMVDTIGSALGDARRGATLAASATFALGTLLGGAITFAGLALLGSLVGGGAAGLREGLGAALALAAAVADWRGVRIAPQIRRQVPERWRWTLPLPLACALYGVLLGLGFTTFVLAFAVWALAGVSFASGDPLVGLVVGLAFGAGRALPVLWMAPGLRKGDGARRLDEMAEAPRLWLGLRRLDALGLGVCALALVGASASAAPSATAAPSAPATLARPASAQTALAQSASARTAIAQRGIARASDPSAGSGALAWQQVGGPGLLSLGGAAPLALPGVHPALGGPNVAWASATQVTVAERDSLRPRAVLAASGVNALAVSEGWVVYRDEDPRGEHLIAASLAEPSMRRYLSGARLAGRVGRPSLEGASVVFTIDTPARSTIELVELVSGHRRTLRSASRGVAFFNPALLGGRLLFERVTRCAQQLRIGPVARPAHASKARERVLLGLPSAVARDPGYQVGYTHAYNSASGCPNRRPGRGGTTVLGATALGARSAYVTELGPGAADAEIVTVAR